MAREQQQISTKIRAETKVIKAWNATSGPWVKMKRPGIGPQVLVIGSMYQGSVLGTRFLTHSQVIKTHRVVPNFLKEPT